MSSKAYHRRIWHEMQHLIAVGVYHIGHWQNNRGQVRWFTEPQLIKSCFGAELPTEKSCFGANSGYKKSCFGAKSSRKIWLIQYKSVTLP